MYQNWNLDGLYSGCDDPAFKHDVARLTELVSEIGVLAGNAPSLSHAEVLGQYLELSEEMMLLSDSLFCYLQLRQSTNASDEEAGSLLGRMMQIESESAEAQAVLQAMIGRFDDLETLTETVPLAREYSYYLSCLKEDAKHLLSGREEAIMAKYNISGGSAWEKQWEYLTSSVKVSYRGQTITLSEVRNLAYSADPAERKDAYEAELACYAQIRDAAAFSLGSIKLQTVTEAELRGFSSPLAMMLHCSRVMPETLDSLLSAMREFLPSLHRYLRAKAKLLGHEAGLPWYDLFAPLGASDASYTPETARAYLNRVFSAFDPKLASMVEEAFEEDWIDFYPKEGKTGGAFCLGLKQLGQSRILTNFGGKFTDVSTLAHELGHAFHDRCVFANRPLNQDYSMPVAETASNFNEILVSEYALSNAESREEKLFLLEGRLSDTTQILCDIYSRFLFEKSVIDARKEEFLFPDRLCALMTDAQKQAYGDGLDENVLHPYMWVCKSHYYSSDLAYYNWPYAFGGLFAQGLYEKYLEMGADFVPLYRRLLNATPVCSVEDAAKIAGIDLTTPDFWRKGLTRFAEMADEFCALAEG